MTSKAVHDMTSEELAAHWRIDTQATRQMQAGIALWSNERLIMSALSELLAHFGMSSPETVAIIRELWKRAERG
jgi:hypothetical protein